MPHLRAWLHRRLLEPVLAQLRQGRSPHSIALAMALGAAVSVVPLLGVSTLLCLALGVALRLNPVVLQAANYAAYPAQLLLLLPFLRAGAWLFGAAPLALTLEELQRAAGSGVLSLLELYGGALARAVGAWGLTLPLLVRALYDLVRAVLVARRRWRLDSPR